MWYYSLGFQTTCMSDGKHIQNPILYATMYIFTIMIIINMYIYIYDFKYNDIT